MPSAVIIDVRSTVSLQLVIEVEMTLLPRALLLCVGNFRYFYIIVLIYLTTYKRSTRMLNLKPRS